MIRGILLSCFVLVSSQILESQAKCPVFYEVSGGDVNCTNANVVGSVCTVMCQDGFTMSNVEGSTTCTPENAWDRPVPYCSRECPPFAKADVVFVVDSSTSMRRVTRSLMKEFMESMINKFTISPNYVRVAIVPYNRDIIESSVVFFDQYDTIEGLLNHIQFLPLNGRGSLTGKALTYVYENVLTPGRGDRLDAPNIVITLTDGRGQDNLKPAVNRLIQDGVATYSVGFHPRNMEMLMPQLIKLAGDDFGRMHLTGRNNIGDLEIMMSDMKNVYCYDVKPRCWPFPKMPENGQIMCNDHDFRGSVCEYVCDKGFILVGATTALTCTDVSDGVVGWSAEPPKCEPIITNCKSQGELKHGTKVCDNDNKVGSLCTFNCTEEAYLLYPRRFTTSQCLNTLSWSNRKPCCGRPCPPYAAMDAILVLDSSSSVGQENWITLMNFVNELLGSFEVGENAARFGVVRYNSKVDTDTQINLKDFPFDRDGLYVAMNSIPYNGVGTYTGEALQHVRQVMLKDSGNRPDVTDVVIVITDGWSSDNVAEVSSDLRKDGVEVYAVAVQRSDQRKFNTEQILSMAGSEERVFVASDGFKALGKDFIDTIVKSICTNPCD